MVTGATGTGKTTTLSAMIDHLNSHRKLNIITLEDPIEFVHKSKESLIIQRGVGTHVRSFAEGLRAALREDPDVILVGELRDPETISMAMTAAETGHLVLGTLHTSSAVKTLDRIVDAMPTEQKALAAIVEIMINNSSIANLILNKKIFQIPSVLQTSREAGMQLMDQALLSAIEEKLIDPDDAYVHATEKKLFQRFVTNPDLLPQINLAIS